MNRQSQRDPDKICYRVISSSIIYLQKIMMEYDKDQDMEDYLNQDHFSKLGFIRKSIEVKTQLL